MGIVRVGLEFHRRFHFAYKFRTINPAWLISIQYIYKKNFTPSSKSSYISLFFLFAKLWRETQKERWRWREGRITKGRALTCQEWVKRPLLIGEGDLPTLTNMVEWELQLLFLVSFSLSLFICMSVCYIEYDKKVRLERHYLSWFLGYSFWLILTDLLRIWSLVVVVFKAFIMIIQLLLNVKSNSSLGNLKLYIFLVWGHLHINFRYSYIFFWWNRSYSFSSLRFLFICICIYILNWLLEYKLMWMVVNFEGYMLFDQICYWSLSLS